MNKPLDALLTRDITAILNALKPSESNHFFGVLRTFFTWCERHELILRSPIARLSKPHKEQSRDRVLSDDELRRVFLAAGKLGGYGTIVKCLILTAQRRGEIAGIKPEYISADAITWPKECVKNGREHSIPLTDRVRQLLPLIPPNNNAWARPKDALQKYSGVCNFTLHDLRRTHSTIQARLGTPPHIIEAILNHASGEIRGVAAIYNRHRYFQETRIALNNFERWLISLVA